MSNEDLNDDLNLDLRIQMALDELIIRVTRQYDKMSLLKIAQEIKEAYTLASSPSPRLLVNQFKKNPEKTRQALIDLLNDEPEAFQRIVPDGIDGQTNCFSKEHFENFLLPQAIEKASKKNEHLSLLKFDIDNFKAINDNYGYIAGDGVIKGFSDLLSKKLRLPSIGKNRQYGQSNKEPINSVFKERNHDSTIDYIVKINDQYGNYGNEYVPKGRLGGGEEFGVILYGCDGYAAKNIVANRILEAVGEQSQNTSIKYTVSAGACQYKEGMTPKSLMGNVDMALAYSKKNGKNRVTLFSELPLNYILSK